MKRNKSGQLKRVVLPLTGVALLMGCQLPSEKRDSIKQMEAVMQQGSDQNAALRKGASAEMSAEVKKNLMQNAKMGLNQNAPPLQKRFDLVAEQVPARTFFLSLVEDTPYNITVHPKVDGTISLQLKKVTVPEVLETVRSVYGFDYRKTPQGIEIMPATLQTRAFSVNYLDLTRKGDSEIQITAGTLSTSEGGNSSNGNNGTTNNGNSTTSNNNSSNSSSTTQGGTNTAPPNSTISTTSTADFWTELKKAVEAIVGTGDGRTVAISPLASLIVVQAMPDELKRVEEFLQSAELTLNRQVILDAKIMEVELNDSFQAGINWSVISGQLNATQLGGETIRTPVVAGNPFPVLSDSLSGGSTGVASPINITPGGTPFNPGPNVQAFGGVFALSTSFRNLGAFIELLGAQGRVQVLSSPRVSTLNNQKALIKVGTDQFFITNISTTTTASTGSSSVTPNATFNTFFSGIALDVTPHITAQDVITLHIHPTISDVEDDTKTFTIGNQTTSIPLAKSSVRESDSMVRAKNGEMVIIGGLMQNNNTSLKQGIPLLKDLPIIGNLFRHTVQKTSKSELVILLRPTVVDDKSRAWNSQVDSALDRFERLDGGMVLDDNRYNCKGPNCERK